jgi:hypothetical protein
VDTPPAGDDVVLVENLRYRDGSNQHWRLDLARQKQAPERPRPAIVVIHGGGWREGDKSSFASTKHGVPGNIVDFAKLGLNQANSVVVGTEIS